MSKKLNELLYLLDEEATLKFNQLDLAYKEALDSIVNSKDHTSKNQEEIFKLQNELQSFFEYLDEKAIAAKAGLLSIYTYTKLMIEEDDCFPISKKDILMCDKLNNKIDQLDKEISFLKSFEEQK
jgi:hypothetical protein